MMSSGTQPAPLSEDKALVMGYPSPVADDDVDGVILTLLSIHIVNLDLLRQKKY